MHPDRAAVDEAPDARGGSGLQEVASGSDIDFPVALFPVRRFAIGRGEVINGAYTLDCLGDPLRAGNAARGRPPHRLARRGAGAGTRQSHAPRGRRPSGERTR